MSKTAIDWADRTWNVVTGCSKVSAGCDHCYAERMSKRLAGRAGYPRDKPFQVTYHDDKLYLPTNWQPGQHVFVNSMGDLFHADVRGVWIEDVLDGIIHRPEHTFSILTKRPQRMLEFMTRFYAGGWVVGTEPWPLQLHHEPIPNLRLGVTAENQEMADQRIPLLLQVPAVVRFVSVEPMLGLVDLTRYLSCEWYAGEPIPPRAGTIGGQAHRAARIRPCVDWVICGGETGPGARPMHPDWVRSVRDQCQAAGVPFFFKGWGEWAEVDGPRCRSINQTAAVNGFWMEPNGILEKRDSHSNFRNSPYTTSIMARVGKRKAGHLLDGREWRRFPEARI